MTIRAHALRCPPPLSDCPHCFGIHRRKSRILPPLLSRVRPNPHPRLMLSCRPLLLHHYRHLLYTPIAASPPPAATNISFVLPIFPLRLLLLRRLLLRPRYRLLCIASSAPPSYFLLFCHCLFCSPGPPLRKIETASKLKQK